MIHEGLHSERSPSGEIYKKCVQFIITELEMCCGLRAKQGSECMSSPCVFSYLHTHDASLCHKTATVLY